MLAVIFDFNGVLVDDEELHFEAFRSVLASRGIPLDRRRYYSELLGFDDEGLLAAVLPGTGATEIEELAARKAAAYADLCARGLQPFDGALALVGALHALGVPMAVVSGALGREVHGALQRFGIASSFRFVVAAEDVGACKPDPAGYLEALARLGALVEGPGECVAIEDSPPGVRAAKAAGMKAIGVAHTVPGERLVEADLVVPSLVALDAAMVLAIAARK